MKDGAAAAFGLFGREDDLRVTSTVLADGGSVVAAGEPGVGKSSLLKVAGQLAQRGGRRVLSVMPTPFERGLPFAGLAELLGQVPEGMARELPEPQRRALDVALQRAEPDGPEADALAVPLAVRGMLTQLCVREPVTVIIDDLQWLDQPSAGSLGFALRRLSVAPERLSVLVGTRPEGSDSDLIRCLPDPVQDLALAPLDQWEIGQLLRKRFGPRWTATLSAGVAQASGGNPFLALMIAEAIEAGALTWGTTVPGHVPVLPVPPSLVGLLRERIELLPLEARDVLLLVSAAGRMTVAQLQRTVEAQLVRHALEAAADADVAAVGAETVVGFNHPLLASAIYDAATPAERRQAHRVLAEKLDDQVQRARHRARTVAEPDERVASELEQAAEISRARGAPELAGELFESAAVATPSERGGKQVAFNRWLCAVRDYMAAGDGVAAGAALDHASTAAVWPAQKAEVLARRFRLADQCTVEPALTEQALRLAPKGSDVRAELLNQLGSNYRMNGGGQLALQMMRMAVAEAAEVKRFDIQINALNEQLAIEEHWGRGDPQQTRRDIDDLIANAPPDLPAALLAWTRGFFAPWHDPSSEAPAREAIKLAVEAGRYGDLSNMYIALILLLCRASRFGDAQAALEEADRIGAWTTSSFQEDMARTYVYEYTGDLDAARQAALRGAARGREVDSTYWTAGFLAGAGFIECSAGAWSAALDALREVADIFTRTKMVDLEQLLWAVDYADAALQVGALDEVETAVGVLRRQGESVRPEALVAADRCESLLKAARGDIDEALNRLVRVVDLDGVECPFEHTRSRLALGQVYRRAGYKGMANQALLDAAEAFDELGVPRWAERARDEAGRVGLHPTTTILTETERRVAELVASGMSNQETASALFMSLKTVEANLTRVYRKLGVRSRTKLANHMNATGSTERGTSPTTPSSTP
jgi:DNA-binding CsgD family transcriptional regulator